MGQIFLPNFLFPFFLAAIFNQLHTSNQPYKPIPIHTSPWSILIAKMLGRTLATVFPLLMLASSAAAVNCETHSFTTCADKIVHWFDPDTGEICDPLDCGGGRAPPKTDVPGCPMYTGTETRGTTPSYLPCWTPSATATATTESTSSTSSSSSGNVVTETSTSTVSDSSVVVVTSTSTETPGSSAVATPSTTPAATLSSSQGVTGSGSASASASNSASAQATTAFNAGGALTGSLAAVAGAALGAIALV